MDVSGSFFRALESQRVPLVTPEVLEALTKKSRDRLTASIVALNRELSDLQVRELDAKASLQNTQEELDRTNVLLEQATLNKEKAARDLSRNIVQRAELEEEALIEQKRINALKTQLADLKYQREELNRTYLDEQNAIQAARVEAHRATKLGLEKEEQQLVSDIVKLSYNISRSKIFMAVVPLMNHYSDKLHRLSVLVYTIGMGLVLLSMIRRRKSFGAVFLALIGLSFYPAWTLSDEGRKRNYPPWHIKGSFAKQDHTFFVGHSALYGLALTQLAMIGGVTSFLLEEDFARTMTIVSAASVPLVSVGTSTLDRYIDQFVEYIEGLSNAPAVASAQQNEQADASVQQNPPSVAQQQQGRRLVAVEGEETNRQIAPEMRDTHVAAAPASTRAEPRTEAAPDTAARRVKSSCPQDVLVGTDWVCVKHLLDPGQFIGNHPLIALILLLILKTICSWSVSMVVTDIRNRWFSIIIYSSILIGMAIMWHDLAMLAIATFTGICGFVFYLFLKEKPITDSQLDESRQPKLYKTSSFQQGFINEPAQSSMRSSQTSQNTYDSNFAIIDEESNASFKSALSTIGLHKSDSLFDWRAMEVADRIIFGSTLAVPCMAGQTSIVLLLILGIISILFLYSPYYVEPFLSGPLMTQLSRYSDWRTRYRFISGWIMMLGMLLAAVGNQHGADAATGTLLAVELCSALFIMMKFRKLRKKAKKFAEKHKHGTHEEVLDADSGSDQSEIPRFNVDPNRKKIKKIISVSKLQKIARTKCFATLITAFTLVIAVAYTEKNEDPAIQRPYVAAISFFITMLGYHVGRWRSAFLAFTGSCLLNIVLVHPTLQQMIAVAIGVVLSMKPSSWKIRTISCVTVMTGVAVFSVISHFKKPTLFEAAINAQFTLVLIGSLISYNDLGLTDMLMKMILTVQKE